MKAIANFLWMILFGWVYSLIFLVLGLVFCLSIVFIPAGIQCFKLMVVAFNPAKYDVEIDPESHTLSNILWVCTFGAAFALEYFVVGVICCITLVGIPFGIRSFKLMKLAYAPCGARIDRA